MSERFQSWQFWSAAKKLLGESRLMMILGRRNGRTIRTYSADPRYTQERSKDPLEHLHTILSELDTFGRGDIARLAIQYLETALTDQEIPTACELQDTIEAEVLADYQAVASMQAAIDGGRPIDEVAELVAAAKAEIDRTLTKYIQRTV